MNNPRGYIDGLFTHGVQALQANDLSLAEKTFKQILREFPGHPDALHFSGLVQSKKGNYPAAIDLINQAISRHGQNPHYQVNLGRVYFLDQQYEKAESILQSAIQLNPGLAEAHYNMGMVKRSQGLVNESSNYYHRVIELSPQHYQAHYNLGNNHLLQGNFKSAISCYETVLDLNPQFASAHNNLGIVLQEWDRWEEAEQHFNTAIKIDPQDQEAQNNLTQLYCTQGRMDDAKQLYQIIIGRGHRDPWTEFKMETLCPIIPESNTAIDTYRGHLNQVLEYFAQKDMPGDLDLLCKKGVEPPSNLTYQGKDDKLLKQKFSTLYQRFIPDMSPLASSGGRRIGFVVTKGHEGVFIKCMKGMILQMADQFEITVVCSLPNGEKILRPAIGDPKVKYLNLPDRLSDAANCIHKAAFNALFYWEVGTDAVNYFLPFFRLAPMQCTSWGWPTTSGIPNMDYFLSQRHLETIDSDKYYSEELVSMKRLPVYYYRPQLPVSTSRRHFGLPETGAIYLCNQNLRKVQPDYDEMVAAVLEKDRSGVIAFIEDKQPNISRLLKERLAKTLAQHNSRVVFLPRMPEQEYLQLLSLSSAVLDTRHYTGGANTTYDAFAMGIPIVTWPTEYHRGRYTCAAYHQIGLSDLIAASKGDYVEKALALGRDQDFAKNIGLRIKEAAEGVFEDQLAVDEMVDFLQAHLS